MAVSAKYDYETDGDITFAENQGYKRKSVSGKIRLLEIRFYLPVLPVGCYWTIVVKTGLVQEAAIYLLF